MTVRVRIILLLLLAFFALCCVGGVALFQSAQSARQVKSVTEGVVPSTIESVELMSQLKDVQMAALSMLSASDADAVKTLYEQLTARKAALQNALASQMRQADNDAQRGLIKEAEMSLENYFGAIDDTARLKLAGQQDAAEATMAATVDQYLREQGQMIEAVQIQKRRSKDEAIAALNARLDQTTKTLLTITGIFVALLAGLGLLLYRQIIYPIAEMETKMTAIAQSQDFSHRVPVTRQDEIGRSLMAFNAMVEKIQESTDLVRKKTADIQAMLHTIPQGILTLEAGGRIHPEYSEHLPRILQTQEIAGRHLNDLLFARADWSADARSQAETVIEACIGEDEMNFDFNAHLLPQELQVRMGTEAHTEGAPESRSLEISWTPIFSDAGTIERLLVSLRDVTELRELSRAAQRQTEALSMIGELLAVPAEKFASFTMSAQHMLDACEQRLATPATPPARAEAVAALFRNMHTIKGNARTYGLLRVADAAHAAEQTYAQLRDDTSAEWNEPQLRAGLHAVQAALSAYRQTNDDTLGRAASTATAPVQIGRPEIDAICSRIDAALENGHGNASESLRQALVQARDALHDLGVPDLHAILQEVVASLPSLAHELGKPVPEVICRGEAMTLAPQTNEALRDTFMHLLRNAMDHGIEAADDRTRQGKAPQGRLEIVTAHVDDHVEIRLRDDGRGLNLDRIQQKAIAAGRIDATHTLSTDEIAHLIFAPGLSTAEQVTAISGRGVGMDAVKAFIESLGGQIRLLLTGDAPRSATPFETLIRLPQRRSARPVVS